MALESDGHGDPVRWVSDRAIGHPGCSGPKSGHCHPQEDPLDSAYFAVANKGADEHEAVDQVRSIRSHECCSSGGHGGADDDRRTDSPWYPRRLHQTQGESM